MGRHPQATCERIIHWHIYDIIIIITLTKVVDYEPTKALFKLLGDISEL